MSATNERPAGHETPDLSFHWDQHPETDHMLREWLAEFCEDCEFAGWLQQAMLEQTGTRLIDWIDHIGVSSQGQLRGEAVTESLPKFGYQLDCEDDHGVWYVNETGLFPAICVADGSDRRLVVKVEFVDDFVAANRLFKVKIEGPRGGSMRRARVASEDGCQFYVCERHGDRGWSVPATSDSEIMAAQSHFEAFKLRQRDFPDDASGFELAMRLIQASIADLGTDWTCDLFFAAERDYWQRRNHAARVQKGRQDRLGLGWANHDHHTYRSSRTGFKHLVAVLELLGFRCRERFYAGEEAGWGAQVLEQPGVGIVIFADVDLSPAELAGDFAHIGLAEKSELGTVGLWCQLHGEAFLQAGMHHLECTFDFDAARDQLTAAGVNSMAPFTDFSHLRQAFTVGEVWKAIPARARQAAERGWITVEQAERFISQGSIGSHLEILERNDGFKGFNQTGVSQIILKTDPRNSVQA